MDTIKHKLKMPYIVVAVDEMSDLMLVSGKEIENYLFKNYQPWQKASIHILMATREANVDVITELLKQIFLLGYLSETQAVKLYLGEQDC